MVKIETSKTFGVYQIKSLVNNKIYIGSTSNSFARRWASWRNDLNHGRGKNKHLLAAWTKYGESNFEFSVVEVITDKSKVLEREQFYLDTLKPEYNKNKLATSRFGTKQTEEAKAKISGVNNGRFGKPGYWYGKTRTEEFKAKMRERMLGENNPNSKGLSEEHKAKLAEAAKGNSYHLGCKHSEESREKNRLAHLGRTPWNKGIKTGKGQRGLK